MRTFSESETAALLKIELPIFQQVAKERFFGPRGGDGRYTEMQVGSLLRDARTRARISALRRQAQEAATKPAQRSARPTYQDEQSRAQRERDRAAQSADIERLMKLENKQLRLRVEELELQLEQAGIET